MNYCADIVINANGLYIQNTRGSHFTITNSNPRVLNKGGTMKLNIELSDIEAKAVREFPKYDDIHVWEKQTAQGEQTLHKGFYSAIRKIVDAMRNKEGK